jgi:archaellum component FlaC
MSRKTEYTIEEFSTLTPFSSTVRGSTVEFTPVRVDRGQAIGNVYYTPSFKSFDEIEKALSPKALEFINAFFKRIGKAISDDIKEDIDFASPEYINEYVNAFVDYTDSTESASTGGSSINAQIKEIEQKIKAIDSWMMEMSNPVNMTPERLTQLPGKMTEKLQLSNEVDKLKAEKAEKLKAQAAAREAKKATQTPTPTH